mgnify:CR=1 FL=1
MSAIGLKKGEITCACQLGEECEGNFSHPSMVCCSYSSDPQTKIIWDLKAENEELKGGIQNIIDVKDEEIKSLDDKLVVVKAENVKLKLENDEMNEELWGEAK